MSLTNGKIDIEYEENNYVFHTNDISIKFTPNQLENIIGNRGKIIHMSDNVKYIESFNISNIKPGKHVYIIGKTCSGKTELCNKIAKQFIEQDISGTIIDPFLFHGDSIYADINIKKYSKFALSYLDNLIVESVANNTKKFIIFDDESTLKYNNDNYIIPNCIKKDNVSIIITSKIGLNIDYDFDYIFLNSHSSMVQRFYYKFLLYKFPTYEIFKNIYNKITSKPYTFMVYDIKNDMIYMFKCNLH